jgi:uncharacterized protein YbcC (UPF0753/DUF2309 family)
MARWSMPHRERGMLACFRDHLALAPSMLPRWLRAVLERLELARSRHALDASALCIEVLEELGVSPDSWGPYIARLLVQLPGWAGMVARLEEEPALGARAPRLLDFVAVRLVVDVEALRECAIAIGHQGPVRELHALGRERLGAPERRQAHDAPYRLLQLCEVAGLAAPDLLALGASGAAEIVGVLDRFDRAARERTFHEAYEHHHLREVLGAIADNHARPALPASSAPRFQVCFCIDDREESIRRAFEEIGPDHVTLSTAGFFGLAIRYQALDDPRAVSLCPVIVEPSHALRERARQGHDVSATARARRRALAAWARHVLEDGSRSLFRGAVLTPLLGLLMAVPMVLRLLRPRLAARMTDAIGRALLSPTRTHLSVSRREDEGEGAEGFSLEEQVDRVASTLENIGLTSGFAPLVVVLGHGSAARVNNPHHSAYECGACGGRNGGPNARAYAAMANDPAVRDGLRRRGIAIPDCTFFVGGTHDTASDAIELFDLDLAPASLASEVRALIASLEHARRASAHERCRRFDTAPEVAHPDAALAHVEERSVALSEPRPELGHATNAVCVVGPRALTRGLFLDRRAFLQSYDASIDDSGAILDRILGAVVPVGAGISLEYYFSRVDELRWGSSTKLPHNVTGLLGVMEGAAGDLRTGLTAQMAELHEPVRLLCVVVAHPEAIFATVAKRPDIAELVANEWVRIAIVDPASGAISVLGRDGLVPFVPDGGPLPVVRAGVEWYRGKRGFVPPARIEAA